MAPASSDAAREPAKGAVSCSARWKLERKPDANPSIEITQKLAEALGTTVGTLLIPSPDHKTPAPETPESLRVAKKQFKFKMTDQEVRRVADETWLVLLSELPDPDDDPDLVEREAEEEMERRRMSFRRY